MTRSNGRALRMPNSPQTHSTALEVLTLAGRTGVLAGAGYFDWSGRTPDALFADATAKLLALKRAVRQIVTMRAKPPCCRQNGVSPHTVIRRMMRVSAG